MKMWRLHKTIPHNDVHRFTSDIQLFTLRKVFQWLRQTQCFCFQWLSRLVPKYANLARWFRKEGSISVISRVLQLPHFQVDHWEIDGNIVDGEYFSATVYRKQTCDTSGTLSWRYQIWYWWCRSAHFVVDKGNILQLFYSLLTVLHLWTFVFVWWCV